MTFKTMVRKAAIGGRVEPLPRLDSNQNYKNQNLASYQLDDRALSKVFLRIFIKLETKQK